MQKSPKSEVGQPLGGEYIKDNHTHVRKNLAAAATQSEKSVTTISPSSWHLGAWDLVHWKALFTHFSESIHIPPPPYGTIFLRTEPISAKNLLVPQKPQVAPPPPPRKQTYICPKTWGGGSLMALMDFCQCWPFSRCYVSRRGGYVTPF